MPSLTLPSLNPLLNPPLPSSAVGAAIVDVSPLSTIGALCIAGVPEGAGSARLFRQMLAWGFAMVPVGALFCQFCLRLFVP